VGCRSRRLRGYLPYSNAGAKPWELGSTAGSAPSYGDRTAIDCRKRLRLTTAVTGRHGHARSAADEAGSLNGLSIRGLASESPGAEPGSEPGSEPGGEPGGGGGGLGEPGGEIGPGAPGRGGGGGGGGGDIDYAKLGVSHVSPPVNGDVGEADESHE